VEFPHVLNFIVGIPRASDQVDVNGLVAVEATDSGSGKGALNQFPGTPLF
jgi:hypothetical protein